MTTAGKTVPEPASAAVGGGRRSKSAATRRRILDAAARTFQAHGYAGARLADIATAAGTKAGSLYYHFASRDALVEEVFVLGIDRVSSAVRERVEALPADAVARDRLAAAIEAHVETTLEVDAYTSASLRILGQVPEAIRNRHLKRQRAYGDYWRALLANARDEGALRPDLDLSAARMLVLGMLNWIPEWYRADGLSAQEVAREAVTIALDGLMGPDRG